jgi:hypothetical protein
VRVDDLQESVSGVVVDIPDVFVPLRLLIIVLRCTRRCVLHNDCGGVPKGLRLHPQSGPLSFSPLGPLGLFSFFLVLVREERRRPCCCGTLTFDVSCRLKTRYVWPLFGSRERVGARTTDGCAGQIRRKLVIVGDGKRLFSPSLAAVSSVRQVRVARPRSCVRLRWASFPRNTCVVFGSAWADLLTLCGRAATE